MIRKASFLEIHRHLFVGLIVTCVATSGPGAARAMHAGDGPEAQEGETRNFSVSVQASAGYLNGEARETVYWVESGSRSKLSELIWDLKDLYMAGANASLRVGRKFRVNLGGWAAVNEGNGQMEDFDWLSEKEGTPWTDWSLSDVDVTRAYMLDLNASYEFFKPAGIALRGVVGYKQDYWAWKDYGVRHVYSTDPDAPGGFRDDVGEDNGETLIIYNQLFQIPYLGISAGWASAPFQLDTYALYSPFVMAEDEDDHLARDLHFEETFSGGSYYGIGIRGTVLFARRFFVSGFLEAQFIPEIIGDTTVTGPGGEVSSQDDAGIQHQAAMVGLSAGMRF